VIEMLLHANGTYTYREVSQNGILKAVHRNPLWRVKDGILILDISGEETLGFLWQKARQKRTVEQHVHRVEIPAQLILEIFHFEAFVQQDDPFPDHVPVPPGRRIGGIIDPLSCILISPALSQDRMPLRDLEVQFIKAGIDAGKIVSDITMMDSDKDGNISQTELMALDDYGREVAPPEVLDEFRQGLLETFRSLQEAFQDMCQGSSDPTVPAEKFNDWVSKKKDMTPDEASGDTGRLKNWCEGIDNPSLKLVFESINVERDGEIKFDELESLQLHSAVLTLQRVDHFCHFIKSTFGGNSEHAWKRAWRALDVHKKGSLPADMFIAAVNNNLGYPYTDAAYAVFAMANRNFSKQVAEADFVTLHHFHSRRFLTSLEDFKVMVDAKCNGVERCFQFFVDEEKKLASKKGGLHQEAGEKVAVSFAAFESVCKKKGMMQGCKHLDLKTVFIFLDEVTGGHASGFLTMKEWSLLQGFDARAIKGCPARLRKALKQKFSTLDGAFDALYSMWLPHELRARLDMLSLARVMHVLGHDASDNNSTSKKSPLRAANTKSNIVEVRVGKSRPSTVNGEGDGNVLHNMGRITIADWVPTTRTEHVGSVAEWKIRNTWRLPGVLSKPKGWPKDDGGRKAQTPRAGTVSAIDWSVRC